MSLVCFLNFSLRRFAPFAVVVELCVNGQKITVQKRILDTKIFSETLLQNTRITQYNTHFKLW